MQPVRHAQRSEDVARAAVNVAHSAGSDTVDVLSNTRTPVKLTDARQPQPIRC